MNARHLAICVCFISAFTFTACDQAKQTKTSATPKTSAQRDTSAKPETSIKPDLANSDQAEASHQTDAVAKPATSEKLPELHPKEEAAPLTTPRGSLTYQMELLNAGDFKKLKPCFTERLRSSITAESVAKGKKELSSYTLDDLFASEERGEYQGSETCKVKMKNGRTLTTFILQDGNWLADTVWFQ